MLEIGGTVVSKYKAVGDEAEVVLIVKADDMFFGVLACGRQAYRADKIKRGQVVEVKGPIVDYSRSDEYGKWKLAYSVKCERLRLGDEIVRVNDPLEDYPEMPKYKIFEKCEELSRS